MSLVDIQSVVEDWAWETYQETQTKGGEKLKISDVRMDINWDRVVIKAGKPQYDLYGQTGNGTTGDESGKHVQSGTERDFMAENRTDMMPTANLQSRKGKAVSITKAGTLPHLRSSTNVLGEIDDATDQSEKDRDMMTNDLTQMIFRSTFNNRTANVQEHSFKTERQTTAVSHSSIQKGYTIGATVGLKLGVPGSVLQATTGFGYETTVGKAEGSSQEHRLVWTTDSVIKVPPKNRVIAELEVKEEEYYGKFVTKVTMQGNVLVVIRKPADDDQFVKAVEGTIDAILRSGREKFSIPADVMTVSNKIVTWTVAGECKFKYGVEQNINIREEPLK